MYNLYNLGFSVLLQVSTSMVKAGNLKGRNMRRKSQKETYHPVVLVCLSHAVSLELVITIRKCNIFHWRTRYGISSVYHVKAD